MDKEVPEVLIYSLACLGFSGGFLFLVFSIDVIRGWDWYSAQQSVQRIFRWAREKLAGRKAANR